jgi:hypothetical protein
MNYIVLCRQNLLKWIMKLNKNDITCSNKVFLFEEENKIDHNHFTDILRWNFFQIVLNEKMIKFEDTSVNHGWILMESPDYEALEHCSIIGEIMSI